MSSQTFASDSRISYVCPASNSLNDVTATYTLVAALVLGGISISLQVELQAIAVVDPDRYL